VIPDEEVERARDAADIVQIIGEHVRLKRVGTSFRGPCPFHQGSGPNFSVVPGKGYKCFVCGEGGDVYSFLQKHLGVDFTSAVRMVAEKSGIVLREVESRRAQGPDPREPLWEANAAAAEFYRHVLWDGAAGTPAREYVASRAVSRELADRVELGFAPRDTDSFLTHFKKLGVDEARLVEAGLAVPREGLPPRPRFRDRLMFPILDASGRHVGFGGRLLGPGEPKYLNSPESPVFSKGKQLYGQAWARNAVRKADRVLLVEGYFDALRLLAAGFEETVAPLGTALTDAQAALLVKMTRNIFLLYDSDRAGLKATFRAGDELLRHGASVRVVTFPEGEDPDTFVRAHGRDRMEAQLSAAVDVFERKVQILDRAGWFSSLDKKRRALDRLIPTIRAASDPLMRDLYLGRAAEAAGVARDLLAREVEAEPRRRTQSDIPPEPRSTPASQHQSTKAPQPRSRKRDVPAVASEWELLRVMLHVRGAWPDILPDVRADTFRDARTRAIFEALVARGPQFEVGDVAAALDPVASILLEKLLAEGDLLGNPKESVAGSLNALRRRDLDQQSAELQRMMSVTTSEDELNELMEQKTALNKARQAIGGSVYNPFDKRTKPPGRSSGAS
jgi:DNA primase